MRLSLREADCQSCRLSSPRARVTNLEFRRKACRLVPITDIPCLHDIMDWPSGEKIDHRKVPSVAGEHLMLSGEVVGGLDDHATT